MARELAGELKHGPIALIEAGLPVVVVVPPALLYAARHRAARRGAARLLIWLPRRLAVLHVLSDHDVQVVWVLLDPS